MHHYQQQRESFKATLPMNELRAETMAESTAGSQQLSRSAPETRNRRRVYLAGVVLMLSTATTSAFSAGPTMNGRRTMGQLSSEQAPFAFGRPRGGSPDSLLLAVVSSAESDAAFERKNASRKKFGLAPLSREQFDEVENQVRALEAEQKAKALAMVEAKKLAKSTESNNNVLSDIFGGVGGVLQNTCETNDDCERPQVCCDLVVKKMCCSSGRGIFEDQGQLIPALVPVPAKMGDIYE